MVSPEPDVVEERLSENHEFLILACDGTSGFAGMRLTPQEFGIV